jgi:predicted RNase H-like HicB family nuclease
MTIRVATEGGSVEFTARVHREDDGTYWAQVVDLPGCFASGDSLDELGDALREAVALYLDCDLDVVQSGPVAEVDEMKFAVPA